MNKQIKHAEIASFLKYYLPRSATRMVKEQTGYSLNYIRMVRRGDKVNSRILSHLLRIANKRKAELESELNGVIEFLEIT
jgi:hypothetical protein